jgi:hypothetical protein
VEGVAKPAGQNDWLAADPARKGQGIDIVSQGNFLQRAAAPRRPKMGLYAHIYLISLDAYSCVLSGDIAAIAAGDMEGMAADLDKAWHAIHYLVTGDCELTLLAGGVQMKDVSEHCEAHSPESIRALRLRLSSTSIPAMMANFDAEVFNAKEIYGGPGWDDSARDYIEKHLKTFISVIGQAAGQGKGILVVLC